MINLTVPTENFEISVLEGVTFTVTPLTTFDMAVAQAAAQSKLDEMENGIQSAQFAGMVVCDDVDLSNDIHKTALYKKLLYCELAERHIVSWSGVLDELGAPVDINLEGARRIAVSLYPIGEIFFSKYTQYHAELVRIKKDSGSAVRGTLNAAAVPNTAKTAH